MSGIIQTGANIKAQYVQESSYGVCPTSPAFLWIGPHQSVDPDYTRKHIKVPAVGSRDIAYIMKGLAEYGVSLEYVYQNSTFLKLALSSSPLTSFTLEVWLEKAAGGIDSLLNLGSLIEQVQLIAAINEPLKVKAEVYCQNATLATSHPSGASYSSDPGTVPKGWYDSQCTVSSGTAVIIDGLTDWTFTVKNNFQRQPVIRSTSGDLIKYMVERQRNYTGELTVAYIDESLLTQLINCPNLDITFAVGTDTYKFSGCKFDSNKLTGKIPDVIPQKIPFTAKTLAVTP
jgi:hypothetical protein